MLREGSVVSVAERVLHLRARPELEQVPVGDLAPLAAAGREVSYSSRTVLVPRGEPAPAAYVALSGRMRALRDGSPLPGDPVVKAFGAYALFGGAVFDADIVAEPGALLLVLDADVVREALEDAPSLLRSLLRGFAGNILRDRAQGDAREPRTPVTEPPPGWLQSPDLAERMFLLQQALQLGPGGLTVLGQLARAAEVRADGLDRELWSPGTPVGEVRLVLGGTLQILPGPTGGWTAERGHFLGLVEVLAESPWQHRARVTLPSTSLVIPASEVAAVLEDHFQLGLEVLRRLARESWLRRTGTLALEVS